VLTAVILTCGCVPPAPCACQSHLKASFAVAAATAAAAACVLLCVANVHLTTHQASKEDDSAAEKGSGAGNWAFKYVLNKARESVNKLVNKDDAAPAPEGMQGSTVLTCAMLPSHMCDDTSNA
jgi:hypothetical protein